MCKTTAPGVLLMVMLLLTGLGLGGCLPDETVTPPEEGLRLAADHDFIREQLEQLQELYDLEFSEVHGMVTGLTHEALKAGDVDVATGHSTDGKLKELDLVALVDDKGFFGANHPAPVVREEVLELYPEMAEILERISTHLDTETIIHLNYQVGIEEEEPGVVAHRWLEEHGFLAGDPHELQDGDAVVVGSKDFVEQRILGQLALAALKHAGIPVQDHTDLGGTMVNRVALAAGRLHLYWEYTGKAWHDIHKMKEVESDIEQLYQQVAALDRAQGLIWLAYAPANSTMSLIIRGETARDYEIDTISALVRYAKSQDGP